MTVMISADLANAMLNAIETSQGASCKLQVWTGTPVTPTTTPAGVKLVEMALPADWLTDAVAGIKSKNGLWQGTALADGIAGSYRFVTNAGTGFSTGTVGISGVDMEIDSTSIIAGQAVSVVSFDFKFPGF